LCLSIPPSYAACPHFAILEHRLDKVLQAIQVTEHVGKPGSSWAELILSGVGFKDQVVPSMAKPVAVVRS
jgi:hypothetical protein